MISPVVQTIKKMVVIRFKTYHDPACIRTLDEPKKLSNRQSRSEQSELSQEAQHEPMSLRSVDRVAEVVSNESTVADGPVGTPGVLVGEVGAPLAPPKSVAEREGVFHRGWDERGERAGGNVRGVVDVTEPERV